MSKRRELELQRQQAQRRQTMIIMAVIAVIAIVLIGGAVILSANQNSQPQQPVNVSTDPLPANAQPNQAAWGPADAPIKIEEFLDYQCPACGAFAKRYEKDIVAGLAATGLVRFEAYPLNLIDRNLGGSESRDATAAVYCAADQDKFWPMHNALFANQAGEGRGAFARARLKEIAAKAGLNADALDACISSGKYNGKAEENWNTGVSRGFRSTPTFYVNGQKFEGIRSLEDFRKVFAQVAPNVQLNK